MEKILEIMRNDEIKRIVQKDRLIRLFGSDCVSTEKQVINYKYISMELRYLGRLLSTVNIQLQKVQSLEQVLHPSNFTILTQAALKVIYTACSLCKHTLNIGSIRQVKLILFNGLPFI